jgi:sterol O-acyltransferase
MVEQWCVPVRGGKSSLPTSQLTKPAVSWDQYARDWNRPVHNFLLRHVYHTSISTLKVGKPTAAIITFLLSACVHELIMWCLFKKLRGYLLALQMFQLPVSSPFLPSTTSMAVDESMAPCNTKQLVQLSRTKPFRGRRLLGNLIFWLGLCIGPSILCSLYLVL